MKQEKSKRRISLFANDLMFEKDTYKLISPFAWNFLESLSNSFEIILIIYISNNQDTSDILKQFDSLIEKKIIKSHVSNIKITLAHIIFK